MLRSLPNLMRGVARRPFSSALRVAGQENVEIHAWVHEGEEQTRLLAAADVGVGEVLSDATGLDLLASPDMYSVQVSATEHAECEGTTLAKTNHSCAPNCEAVVSAKGGGSIWLRAIEKIQKGDAASFDYDTTEWHMATPFKCACGAVDCRGSVGGFSNASPEQQAKLLASGRVAPHIEALHAKKARK